MGKLSATAVRNAKGRETDYKLSDGGGLYLLVKSTGSRLWRYDFRLGGKRRTMAIGVYPDVELASARDTHEAARKLVAAGEDPIHTVQEELDAAPTFQETAARWLEARERGWAAENHRRIKNRLEQDVYPEIGHIPICELGSLTVLAMLRKIEARGVGETVYRIKGYVSEICGFAIGEGLCESDPTGPIDAGKLLKPKPRKQHRAALKATEFPTFLTRLADSNEEQDTIDALRLVLWTVGRTDEIRFAHRDEFEGLDGDAPLWRLSGKRMKMHLEHLVPLPRQAVPMLRRRIERVGDSGLLFERKTRSGTLSENTLLYACYRLGYHSRITVHGFRGSFSTIANEATRINDVGEEVRMWDADWIERCLAHVEGDTVRGAYNSAEWIGPRRRLLQWWADWLDTQEHLGRFLG